ncbi:MAG: bis-aminopropyl spermidine synthase family protein [Promethearchaeota archaeon]|jgi:predicted methyltransferase
MTNEIKDVGEIYKLLISGNYVEDSTTSFLDFIKILRVIKTNKTFPKCFKKSQMGLDTFLGILEFLQNVNIIKLVNQHMIKIQNEEIFTLVSNPLSRRRAFTKSMKFLYRKLFTLQKRNILTRQSLLKLFDPEFKLNVKNFQLPCSVKSSFKRALMIGKRIYFPSQKALFIGDDDLISILCKFFNPELSISVIEIDGRITKLLKNLIKKYKFMNFDIYNQDFKEINELQHFMKSKYSIVNLDPPYEANELEIFLKKLDLVIDPKCCQIFLNGLYNNSCMSLINRFIEKNQLILAGYYKSFNSYPLYSVDQRYLEALRKHIKFENKLKFKARQLKSIELLSDLFILEKSWIEKSD